MTREGAFILNSLISELQLVDFVAESFALIFARNAVFGSRGVDDGGFVDIASYALLTMMVAQCCGLEPGDFVHTLGDAHIYTNHFEQVALQLSRQPRPLPKMIINPDKKDIFNFKYEDFELTGYDPWPSIKAPVAV